MDISGAKVSSAELMTLQSDLIQLSGTLHELYELMNSDVSSLGEYWRDQKFDEFLTGYKPQMDKMEEISERYHEWATKDLQITIDHVVEAEGVDVSGGSSSSSGGSSSSDSTSSSSSSNNPFLKGIQNVQKKMQGDGNPAMQKKWNSEHTHKEGLDSNERAYPHQGIIDNMAKKAEEAEQAKRNNNMFAYLMQKGNSR